MDLIDRPDDRVYLNSQQRVGDIRTGPCRPHVSGGGPFGKTKQEAAIVVVSGRVQGVGFRFFTRRQALEHGVVGTVRNLPDGRVEVRAEGSRDALDALAADLRRGPSLSVVLEVAAAPAPVTAAYTSFEIAY